MSLAPIIDASGIRAPSYAEIFAELQVRFRTIYGQDVYLEPDSQDGQWLAVIAAAINDANAVAIGVYNSFSPGTAQGAALSNNVKINGIARAAPTHSSADVRLVGQVGTTIERGVVEDANRGRWNLPELVVIPAAGEIVVTATAQVLGDVRAPAGSITTIATPVRGWQSVTNPTDAVAGAPVESDASLRVRQATSVALPSRTVLEGTVGAVARVPGVVRYRAFENDTPFVDANGIPPHSIAVIAEGGDAADIARAIAMKKTPGTGTYGNTAVTVEDIYGNPITIRFFRPIPSQVTAQVTIAPLKGYSAAVADAIVQAIVGYVASVPIGGGASQSVEWADAITAANSIPDNATFKVTGLSLAGPAGAGTPDVSLPFNSVAVMGAGDVTLVVT